MVILLGHYLRVTLTSAPYLGTPGESGTTLGHATVRPGHRAGLRGLESSHKIPGPRFSTTAMISNILTVLFISAFPFVNPCGSDFCWEPRSLSQPHNASLIVSSLERLTDDRFLPFSGTKWGGTQRGTLLGAPQLPWPSESGWIHSQPEGHWQAQRGHPSAGCS